MNGSAVIMDIDIQGAAQIRKKMPEAVFVFLMPPTWDELRQRLVLRGSDAEDVISQRLAKSKEEIRHIVEYDYFIINDDLAKAAEQLRHIILSEWSRTTRVDLDQLQSFWKGGADE